MSEYANAIYSSGQEWAVSMIGESDGMLGPDVTTIPALGTLALVGYTNVPGISIPHNVTPQRAAGMAKPAAAVRGRKEPVIDLTGTFGSTLAFEALLLSAIRKSSVVAGTHQCLPVVALGVHRAGACQSGRAKQRTGRFSLFNTLTITAQEGQPVTAQMQAWPLYIDKETVTVPTVSDSTIQTAGGYVFSWDQISFDIDGTDYSDLIQSVTIQLNNNLRRVGIRPLAHGAKLHRAARQIQVGPEDITIQLNLFDELPDEVLAAMATLTMVMAEGATAGDEVMTITCTSNYTQSEGQNATGAEGQITYNTSILSTDLTIARSVVS